MAKLKVNNDGPILVEGDFELCDGDGATFDTDGKERIALCRCGHSANKPFCDGAHGAQSFESSVKAGDA